MAMATPAAKTQCHVEDHDRDLGVVAVPAGGVGGVLDGE
jgi:hypothetical protein